MRYTAGLLADHYRACRDARRAVVDRLERRHTLLGGARLTTAGVTLGLLWWQGLAGWPWWVTTAAAFLALVIVHARLLDARDRARRSVDFYEAGMRRLAHTWAGHGDDGRRFAPDGTHPYAADLDLFGQGGLFELLGTCRTEAGLATLAAWLLEGASADDIRARQAAIRELAPQVDVRERLYVEGAHIGARLHPRNLAAWATAAPSFGSSLVTGAPLVAGLVSFALPAAAVWRYVGGPAGLTELVLTLQLLLAAGLRARVLRVITTVDTPARELDRLTQTARLIEAGTWSSDRLRALQARLRAETRQASDAIADLSRLATLLASRRNVMFAPLAAALLWATQLAFRVERWRARHGRQVPEWLDALGEFDALAALAGYAAEHPDTVFPLLEDGPAPLLESEALTHPLLGPAAVANDLRLGGDGPRLWLISGSNMSGKSTWLRTVGLAVVLAQTGAPVRARRCRLSTFAVGASIRLADSLQDGRSRFYAEILRLKQVVDLAKRSPDHRMVFLLDEMLSGTNSHDRRQGAEGVLRGLVDLGAVGLATTHDLALGDIVHTIGRAADQAHFADAFDGGTLQFDYRLRPGPVRSSNALALMRSVGLDVPS